MSEFDEIVRHVFGYKPNGDGTQTGYPPCAVCGCTAFIFDDDRPACLACHCTDCDVDTYAEAVESALARLVTLSQQPLTPKARERLSRDLDLWRLQVELIAVGVKP